ncbi:hypothetical protein BS78_02G274700 [Paspalum vaginatum]|nr:hypothetical protein BS78_02G274700 [Paspalum vaginatum]
MAADRCSSLGRSKSESVADRDRDLESESVDEFVAEDKDLESDQAMWALYERWCKAFNQPRDRDEMLCYFNEFKDAVRHVISSNKAGLPYTLGINKFADGKLMKRMLRNHDADTQPPNFVGYPGAVVYRTGGGGFRFSIRSQ